MQLYEINQNGNKYCGPSVVSAIAGIGTKEAAAIFRERNGRTAIKGSSHYDVLGALRLLGFDASRVISYPKAKRVTLRSWAKANARGTAVHLVDAGNHWVLVQGRYAMCGKTLNLVPVEEHPSARTFVKSACVITKAARSVNPATVIPKGTQTEASARRKAVALAAKHGIGIERGEDKDSSIGVWQARGHHDPYMDGHYFDGWSEVLARVQEYAQLQTDAATPAVMDDAAAKPAALALAQQHGIMVEQEADGHERAKWVKPPAAIRGHGCRPVQQGIPDCRHMVGRAGARAGLRGDPVTDGINRLTLHL